MEQEIILQKIELISSTVYMTIILKVCLHVWKLLLYVFVIWLLIKFQYDLEKQAFYGGGKKELRPVLSGFRARKICRPSVESSRQRETHCQKPDRMEKEKERREEGEEGMNWDGFNPNFQVIPPVLFKNRKIYILSTLKCLNGMFSKNIFH